jgi:hypothetical protein
MLGEPNVDSNFRDQLDKSNFRDQLQNPTFENHVIHAAYFSVAS